MRDPFWHSTRLLWDYKRPLALAALGAVISAGAFGAGLGMLLPTFELLLNQRRSVRELINDLLARTELPGFLASALRGIGDRVPADPFAAFVMVMVVIALLSVIGSVGRYLHELQAITVVNRAAMVWRTRLFRRLIHAPLVQVLRTGTADHIGRVVMDTRVLSLGYHALLGKAVASVFNGAVALLAALWLDWKLTLLALVGAPLIAVLLRKFGKRIRRASRRMLQHRGRMIAALNESLGGIRVVKVHNAEGYERRRFAVLNRRQFNEEMKMRQAKALASPLVETLAQIGVMIVATIAAWMIFRRNLAPAEFMTVLTMIAAAGMSLRPLANLHTSIQEARAAAKRVYEALGLEVEPTMPAKGRAATGGPATKPGPGTARLAGGAVAHAQPLKRHAESVAFEDVRFTYPGKSAPALDGVSLNVRQGQTVAIVGGNGSGKTTLTSLLPRLLEPDAGRVLIDGVDIATVKLRSLRRQLAVVTQQSILFEGTIGQNIAYGRRHTPHDRIVAAARAAHAHAFIEALPDGYDTPLGEDGAGLSGGQMQRICIARAILRDPAILILDEATSQIDADSEAEINKALREIRAGRTTFVIAHRLSTVIDAGLIVVMDAGRIVDQGPHEELLSRCGVYRTLAQTQLRPPAA